MLSLYVLGSLFFYVKVAEADDLDYYWRDYYGVIPEDSYPAGKDISRADTYVGQVYIHKYGLFVGQLHGGVGAVQSTAHGIRKGSKSIKILCTKQKEHFYWMPTTASRFLVDSINRHAVVGGYDHCKGGGVVNIGRVMYQGILKTGQVQAFNANDVYMTFVHDSKEIKVATFEVLMYRLYDNRSDICASGKEI